MGNVHNRLRPLLEPVAREVVKHNGQDNRRHEPDGEPKQADFHRIAEHLHELRVGEHDAEIIQSDPLALPYARAQLQVFERHDPSHPDRPVADERVVQQDRDKQQIQCFVRRHPSQERRLPNRRRASLRPLKVFVFYRLGGHKLPLPSIE